MKRALLTAALVLTATPSPGALADTLRSTDADGLRTTGRIQQAPAPVDGVRGDGVRRVARDDSITWSEPFYRYGQREPAMEELAANGDSPKRGAAAHLQLPH